MTAVVATPTKPSSPPGVGTDTASHPGVPTAGSSFAAFLARPRPVAAASAPDRIAPAHSGPATHARPSLAPHNAPPGAAHSAAADSESADDPLDPLHRHRAALLPPQGVPLPPVLALRAPTPVVAPEPSRVLAAASLEHLLPALVRRVAWSGDGRRGTARLEIGAGDLAGAVLQIDADEGRVRIHLEVPPGVDARAWHERIERSLRDRNVVTDALEVT